jgi:hypothetical protein
LKVFEAETDFQSFIDGRRAPLRQPGVLADVLKLPPPGVLLEPMPEVELAWLESSLP